MDNWFQFSLEGLCFKALKEYKSVAVVTECFYCYESLKLESEYCIDGCKFVLYLKDNKSLKGKQNINMAVLKSKARI